MMALAQDDQSDPWFSSEMYIKSLISNSNRNQSLLEPSFQANNDDMSVSAHSAACLPAIASHVVATLMQIMFVPHSITMSWR